MAPGDLITEAEARTALPDMTDAQALDLAAAISAASAEIARRYPRAAAARDLDETHDPGPGRTIQLGSKPVLAVNRVRTRMTTVLKLGYSGASRRAIVRVTQDGEGAATVVTGIQLALESNGQTAVVAELSATYYPTLAQLSQAVALMEGWSTEIGEATSDMPTTDIEPNQGPQPAKGAGASVYAYADDARGYALKPAEGVLILMECYPDSYRTPDRRWGMDPRLTQVRVQYTAGTTTTPADVKRAAILTVAEHLAGGTTSPYDAEQSDDYMYRAKKAGTTLPPAAARILSRYKDRGFS